MRIRELSRVHRPKPGIRGRDIVHDSGGEGCFGAVMLNYSSEIRRANRSIDSRVSEMDWFILRWVVARSAKANHVLSEGGATPSHRSIGRCPGGSIAR